MLLSCCQAADSRLLNKGAIASVESGDGALIPISGEPLTTTLVYDSNLTTKSSGTIRLVQSRIGDFQL